MEQTLAVLLTGDPLLRQKAAAIADPSDLALKALVDAMLVTMRTYNGIGIAAPQVGHSLRVVIIASQPNSRYPNAPIMEPLVMVNPAIITQSPEMRPDWEGCLSVPGQRLQVLRHHAVEVCWEDLGAHQHQQLFSGFVARIVQHELDHLDGILFTDHVEQITANVSHRPHATSSHIQNVATQSTTTVTAPAVALSNRIMFVLCGAINTLSAIERIENMVARTTLIGMSLLLLLALNGCQDRPASPARSVGHDAVPFAGVYLNKPYLDLLYKHQSPSKAVVAEEFQLVIPDRPQSPVIGGFNSHEGMEPCRLNKREAVWELICPAPDGVREIKPLSERELQLGSTVMVKIDQYLPGYTQLDKLPNYKNRLLFVGSYTTVDQKPVIFLPDGTVQGLALGSTYSVRQDYIGPDATVDLVTLGNGAGDKSMKEYGFRLKDGYLTLFKTRCAAWEDHECVKTALGKQVVRLRKTE